jgi:hypothetical protein
MLIDNIVDILLIDEGVPNLPPDKSPLQGPQRIDQDNQTD